MVTLFEHISKFIVCNGEVKLILVTTSLTKDILNFLSDDYNFEVALRKLNLKDQLKVRNIKDERNKFRALVSRLFQKLVLNYLIFSHQVINKIGSQRSAWEELNFRYNDYGKPHFPEQDALKIQFSFSSSNDVLCLLIELNTLDPIGIDLSHSEQAAISSLNFISQFRPIFGSAELQQLQDIQDEKYKYLLFNQIWTLKEAFVKYIGSGLNIDLSKFEFNLRDRLADKSAKPITNSDSFIKRYDVEWKNDIEISVNGLIESNCRFLKTLDLMEIFCMSSILRNSNGNNLPVIASIITRRKFQQPTDCLEIDFLRVLEHLVDDD
ncbi:uncharacterized protein PRCAT00000424001 [Priceomyces carsonii]|uniref:uncharacterized protein n=1 Tax=Priceomyces carsonii TaxID=28549 RepID=UPI002ED834AC|nr:unnamed protein product [Priceomyces carsonii]